MKISKSIILPEWEELDDLKQTSNILHELTEAMRNHQIVNYEDGVANFRRLITGRIQSQDGETYFDLDSGVIKGEIVFRPGSSGLGNVEEASPNDWDNAFRLADAVKGDDDFTLISGSKILTGSVAVGAFNSDVVARMFASETNKTNIEAWMKSGAITYIDGNKIYTSSILAGSIATGAVTAGKISVTSLAAIKSTLGSVIAGNIRTTRFQVGGGTDEDIYFEDSGIRFYDASGQSLRFYKSGQDGLYFALAAVGGGCKVGMVDGKWITFKSSRVNIYSGMNFNFYSGGTLQLPALTSAPTAHVGDLACNSSADWFLGYISDWEHFQTTDGW